MRKHANNSGTFLEQLEAANNRSPNLGEGDTIGVSSKGSKVLSNEEYAPFSKQMDENLRKELNALKKKHEQHHKTV